MGFTKKLVLIFLVLTLALVLAACAGDTGALAGPDVNESGADSPASAETDDTDATDATDNPVFPFPFDFSAEDLHGNQVTAESLGDKELFFVYFWTTWCPSCVAAIPGLATLAEEYSGRVGFLSLLGDFETAGDTAIRITDNAGASFITVDARHNDLQPLMDLLNSGFVPTSIILDRDGNAVGGQIVGGGIDRFRIAIEDALGG